MEISTPRNFSANKLFATGASTSHTNAVCQPTELVTLARSTNQTLSSTGKRNTNPNTSLIKIEGVEDQKAANFYIGKRIAYVYRGKREIRGTKIRVIWGKVTRPHGTEI